MSSYTPILIADKKTQ